LEAISTIAIAIPATIAIAVAVHFAVFGPASLLAVALVANTFAHFTGITGAGDE
jgi:hypothetical protein